MIKMGYEIENEDEIVIDSFYPQNKIIEDRDDYVDSFMSVFEEEE